MAIDVKALLASLDLKDENPGAYAPKSGWSKAKDTKLIESRNPATGELIAKVRSASAADYEAIVKESEEAFRLWREVPAPKRGELVRLLGDELRKHKDALGSLVALEMGKIKPEGDGEVQEMIDIADFAVGQSRMLYGNTMHSERPGHRMYEQWHPLGVVGVISAFNFPVAVWAWNACLSAICGNATVWKPSPKTPLCAVAVQKIVNRVLERAGHPGVFSFYVDADSTLGQKMAEDHRIPLVSFTGSTAVGRKVGHTVQQRFGRALLELGGNNAIVVDESADLKLAVPAIVFGAVGTAGQRCTTTRRLIVHESLEVKLVESLKKAYGQVPVGDPLDAGTLMGPLTDEGAVKRYEKAVSDAVAAGGELVTGGKRIKMAASSKTSNGHFVEPTIIRKAKNEWPVVQTETFAPILYVMTFKTLDEAIALHNGVPQGLSSAIFTMNVRNAERFLSATGSDCGIANVNIGTSGAEIGGAFGGEKETGGGRESGSDAWKQYMRRQTNTINWSTQLPLAQGIKFDLG
jgi:aldehyde dehydrogenase (NAD+)